jgi:hypothetical protein
MRAHATELAIAIAGGFALVHAWKVDGVDTWDVSAF